MPEWTKRQEEAITARNRDILVSAAAGSGKTAVLIQRVMGLLSEGMSLDRMLVVTFTHAAADEMKERLTGLLSEAAFDNEHLRAQFSLLGRADISTLHSFCIKLLKRHFQAADTDPLSGTADEALAEELFSRALDEALDSFYESQAADDRSLEERFTEGEITAMARALHDSLMAQDAPFEWLDAKLSEDLSDLFSHPWYRVMAREAGLMLAGAIDLSASSLALCRRPDGPARYLEAVTDDLRAARLLVEELGSNPRFLAREPSFTRLPGAKPGPGEDPELALTVKGRREQVKKLVRGALSLLPTSKEEAAEWMEKEAQTRPQLRALAGLVKDAHARYQALKAARALWDFQDMEHLALKALNDPMVQKEVSSSYDALFVDEYQDISRIQEAIIARLRSPGNSLFMVGDVKQSIYRFRLADPSLFLAKYGRFSAGKDAPRRLISLKENFRSVPNILRAVNLVFEQAMREEATEIAYDEEARLSTLKKDGDEPPVELWMLYRDESLPLTVEPEEEEAEEASGDEPGAADEEEGEGDAAPGNPGKGEMERAFVYEARLIARRVSELVGSDITENGVKRKVQYRDIAILLRSAANRASVMAEILNARDIPTYSDADGEFYTQSDVRDVISILQVLDNPYQDRPLLSALACPAFSFGPEELARLRLFSPGMDSPLHLAFYKLSETEERFREARDRLDRWRLMAQAMPLERFLAQLLRESGLYALAGAKEDGQLRRANLRILVSRAAPLPEPQGLSDFVERALAAMKQKTRGRSASLGMQENVVRIMTMHKSKGLQFPIVILPDLAASIAQRRQGEKLRLDAETGLAIVQIDLEIRTRNEGFGFQAMKAKKAREELSEEARLLYVGMTRARERLILIGAPARPEALIARASIPAGAYAAGSAASMLDWVVKPLHEALAGRAQTLYTAPGGSRWHLAWRAVQDLIDSDFGSAGKELLSVKPLPEEVPEDFFAPLPGFGAHPQKSSVTALVARRQLEDQEEETMQVKRRALPPPGQRSRPRPLAGEALTAAQRGAAAHKALCALEPGDYVGLEGAALTDALEEGVSMLAGRGLLMENERAALDLEALKRFYRGDLARRMAKSPERHAEWPFTLLIEEEMLLQGVLDSCFLEEGQWVLVDYKTDRGGAEELLLRYTPQMRWYMRALRDITGLPVKEAWLYLLSRGEAVAVTEEAPIRLDEAGFRPPNPDS